MVEWYWRHQGGVRLVALLTIAAPVVAVVLLLLVKLAPSWFASTHGLKPKERAEELGRVRTAVLAVMAGLIAVVGAELTRRSYLLSRSGQITERFSRAVEQLGHKSVDVNVGGIYALERIAKDSSDDHPAVIELLTEYVRLNARAKQEDWSGDDPASDGGETRFSSADSGVRDLLSFERPADRAAVQAAMTVVVRREYRRDGERQLELRSADLGRLDLHRARLARAKLSRSNLARAWLHGAHLEEASLNDSCLDDAALSEARLERAHLNRVHIRRAWLRGVHLEHASLIEAHLEGGDMQGASLRGADLTGARLDAADLRGANLDEAVLENVGLHRIVWDALTKWPAGYVPPPSAAPPAE